jgi:hypothetical protein
LSNFAQLTRHDQLNTLLDDEAAEAEAAAAKG